AERSPASQQAIAIAQMAERVERDLHHVWFALERDPVERVDVLESLDHRRSSRHAALHPGCEDERIVRARRIRERQRLHGRFWASFRATACAASAASWIRHLLRSRSSTRLLTPRTSRNGTSCSAHTCAAAAPSIDSHSAPNRSYNSSPSV